MANVLRTEKKMMILNLLVEGNSIRSTSRLTGCHVKTILNLLVSFGEKCRLFLDDEMRGLDLRHVEVDEIWSYVGKKQARLTVDEKETCHDQGDIYLWSVIDQDTLLVPTFAVGKRSADNARRLMMDLARRIKFPTPHAVDVFGYQPVIQISTDGFPGYPEAVDLAFGPYAKYGQIIKSYRNATMAYTPSEIVGTDRRAVFAMTDNEKWSICTSHIERNNLTVRNFMKRFARLTLGFSKKLQNHAAAIALQIAHYNYVWRPSTLGGITPAMAAGVTDRLWNFADLYERIQG